MTDEILERLKSGLAGRYTIERELGRGGMAVVYLAHDVRHDRMVALKVMLPEAIGEEGGERFRREILVAARLNHPNIVTVFDSGEANGLSFYVMPFVEGESLRELLHRERLLGVAEAIGIARQVADALEYAHNAGVIHRDIKPENILITRTRAKGIRHAAVTDFGIARALTSSGATRLTATGMMIGTPSYMSPEQWSGERGGAADNRSDQYSLACVLYEMLIGEPPFTGATPMIVLARQSMEMVPSMRVARPGLPEALELAIDRAMEKVPGDRFASIAEFADAIDVHVERATADHVASASPAASGAQLAPQQNGSFLSPLPASPSRPATVDTPYPRTGARRRVIIASALALGIVAIGVTYALLTGGAPSERTRLMVLPFVHPSGAEGEAFADGLTDEIINRLSGVSRLGVVARTSAMKYKGTTLSARDIGKEVNVDHLVEGKVTFRSGGTGRGGAIVSVALIHAPDDRRIWSEDFAVTTLSDLYRAQSTIATQVAAKLYVNLGDAERDRMLARPTENLAAYEAYQAGNRAFNRSWDSIDVAEAITKYDEATRLDPRFALALAALGKSHAWMFQLGLIRTPEPLTLAKQAIDSALRLAPNLPEAHLAQGLFYYWSARDYERALDEFRIVSRGLPSSAEVHNYVGNIRRRMGAWRDAIESYRLAAELDPRSHQTLFNRAEALLYTRRYDAAETLVDRVTEIAPEFVDGYFLKATLQIQRQGDAAEAARSMNTTAAKIPPDRWRLLGHHWRAGLFRIIDRDLTSAERHLVLGSFGLDTAHYYMEKADTYHRFKRAAQARIYFDSAARYMEATVQKHPEWASASGRLGLVYAGQGRADEAVRYAKKAVDMMPVQSDALDGPEWVINVAHVYALLGNADSAIVWLDRAMRIPSRLSPTWLQLDPAWDPLRKEERFRSLIRNPPELADSATPPLR